MSCNATDVWPEPADAAAVPGGRGEAAGPAVLFIGYGNLLRSDDGVGPAVVSRLAAMFYDHAACATITVHQLTPELAVDVGRARRVVFVDASVELPAGTVRVRRVRAVEAGSPSLGHHLSPESVMALAGTLRDGRRFEGGAGEGNGPTAWAVAVGVANLSVGDRLSSRVSRAAGRLARHLAHRARRWSIPASALPGSDALKKGQA